MKQAIMVLVAKPSDYSMRTHSMQTQEGWVCPYFHLDDKPHYLRLDRVGVLCCGEKNCEAVLMAVREQEITERVWWPKDSSPDKERGK